MSLMVKILKTTELFSSFAEEELELLIQCCEEHRLPKGAVLFLEGEQDDSALYFVQDGLVKIVKGEGAHKTVLAMFGLGNLFGEMSFLDFGPRSATAQTDDGAVVYKLLPAKFQQCLHQAPAAAMRLIQVIATKLVKRLRETDEMLITQKYKIIIT
jgi:CRP-like cAMP-binding protein